MYPEQEDIPGTNITFNEPKDKGEGEGEGEGEGGGEIESATVNKIIQILTSKRAIEHNFQVCFVLLCFCLFVCLFVCFVCWFGLWYLLISSFF